MLYEVVVEEHKFASQLPRHKLCKSVLSGVLLRFGIGVVALLALFGADQSSASQSKACGAHQIKVFAFCAGVAGSENSRTAFVTEDAKMEESEVVCFLLPGERLFLFFETLELTGVALLYAN